MADLGPAYEEVQPEVDAALRRFFMARIGLRFLLQHHIESFRHSSVREAVVWKHRVAVARLSEDGSPGM